MAIIDLRLKRLERRLPAPARPDFSTWSNEELTAELIRLERAKLADPASSEEECRHAQVMLGLPWHLPTGEWGVDALVAFCREVHRHD